MNIDVILFRTFSRVIIITWKVDPGAERGGDIDLGKFYQSDRHAETQEKLD